MKFLRLPFMTCVSLGFKSTHAQTVKDATMDFLAAGYLRLDKVLSFGENHSSIGACKEPGGMGLVNDDPGGGDSGVFGGFIFVGTNVICHYSTKRQCRELE